MIPICSMIWIRQWNGFVRPLKKGKHSHLWRLRCGWMTSASIVKESLEQLGAECRVYLPNRFTDGYGPMPVSINTLSSRGISLIVTVDNGVAGHEAIELAQSMGVDVIVTDHHSMPETLPDAYAIVHPEHPDADYPFKYLAGCGGGFQASLRSFRRSASGIA